MLVIRPEQIAALTAERRRALVARLRRHLVDHHPRAAALESEALDAIISQGVETAARYGLQAERSLGWFVAMLIDISPRFHEHPRIRRVLGDTTLGERAKIEIVLRASERTWEEAARL